MTMRALLAAAALLLIPTAAWADWGATHWGMTLDQLLAAVPGARPLARDGTGSDVWKQQRLAASPWRDGDIETTADFFFDPESHTLTLVKTSPADVKQCPAYADLLVARHGPGKLDERSFENGLTLAAIRWTDPKTHERLIYSRIGQTGQPPSYCHFIQQAPL